MGAGKGQLREEIAELAAEVRALREQLATRGACASCGSYCPCCGHYWWNHYHWCRWYQQPYVQQPYVQPTVIWSSGQAGGGNIGSSALGSISYASPISS